MANTTNIVTSLTQNLAEIDKIVKLIVETNTKAQANMLKLRAADGDEDKQLLLAGELLANVCTLENLIVKGPTP